MPAAAISNILDEVYSILEESGNSQDIAYFTNHRRRYQRMAARIMETAAPGSKILNIGSHYLHTSLIFKFLGYEVDSMDVEEFWNLDFVQHRKHQYGLSQIVENDLARMNSAIGVSDFYDVIVFAEIFEHITFNPVNFWKQIYRITKSGGYVYISTPNSMRLLNILSVFKKLLTFTGAGISIKDIFGNVTYGHHWKEYSAREIKQYFRYLSDDFIVKINRYDYRLTPAKNIKSFIVNSITRFGNATVLFSEELEVFVYINKTGSWKINAPEF